MIWQAESIPRGQMVAGGQIRRTRTLSEPARLDDTRHGPDAGAENKIRNTQKLDSETNVVEAGSFSISDAVFRAVRNHRLLMKPGKVGESLIFCIHTLIGCSPIVCCKCPSARPTRGQRIPRPINFYSSHFSYPIEVSRKAHLLSL